MKNFLILLALLITIPAGNSFAQAKTPKSKVQKVAFDINRATAAQLQERLKGIGEKRAAAIVAYRKKNGAFRSTDDLLKVPGIGGGIVSKNLKALGLPRGKMSLDAAKSAVKKAKNASTKKAKTAKNAVKKSANNAKSSIEKAAGKAKSNAKNAVKKAKSKTKLPKKAKSAKKSAIDKIKKAKKKATDKK